MTVNNVMHAMGPMLWITANAVIEGGDTVKVCEGDEEHYWGAIQGSPPFDKARPANPNVSFKLNFVLREHAEAVCVALREALDADTGETKGAENE